MQKPNVLLISSWYPSKEHETLGNFVQRHAEAIQPLVNLYVVYVTSSEEIKSDFDIENQTINSVNTTVVYYKKVTSKIPGYNSFLKLKNYKKGYRLGLDYLKKEQGVSSFDITHCNVSFPAGLIALDLKKKKNIPYVLTEHWTLFLPNKEDYLKLNGLIKKQIKKIIGNANKVVPVSNHLAVSMRSRGLSGDYKVIPNVVDTNMFELGKEFNTATKQILHVSTLVEDHKNISGIFGALKRMSENRNDFILVIVSDGDIEKTKQLQKEIGLEGNLVEYHSTKTPKEISKFYQDSDLFVLFSNYENLPVVISESHCCGLPVVSSNVGGIPEMIDESNGVLVNPNKEEELENAIVHVLDNLKTYSKQGIRDKAINRYDNRIVGKQFYELYKEIIK